MYKDAVVRNLYLDEEHVRYNAVQLEYIDKTKGVFWAHYSNDYGVHHFEFNSDENRPSADLPFFPFVCDEYLRHVTDSLLMHIEANPKIWEWAGEKYIWPEKKTLWFVHGPESQILIVVTPRTANLHPRRIK